jgi:hypothetical protein
MRNSPYAVHTLGHPEHRIIPVGKAKGLIQGIITLGEKREIDVSVAKDFAYLPTEKRVVFNDASEVEIVSFDGHHSKIAFHSYIHRRRVKLEEGGTLTGPMLWRTASAEPEENSRSSYAGPLALGFVVLVMAIFTGILSLISAKIALPFGGFAAVCLTLFPIVMAFSKMKYRSIERQGSVYVLAPANGDFLTAEASAAP